MAKKMLKNIFFRIGDVFPRDISNYTKNLYSELDNYMKSCESGDCKGYLFLIYKNKKDFKKAINDNDLRPLTDRENHASESVTRLDNFLKERDFKIHNDYGLFFDIVGHHEPEGFDGAFVLSKNGLYLGSSLFIQGVKTRKKKTYNVPKISINPELVDDLKDMISFEPGKDDDESTSGARHIAAQYASKNELILAALAGSEKRGEVTLYVNGVAQDMYKE